MEDQLVYARNQFEIRFTKISQLNQALGNELAPFVKLADNFELKNDGKHDLQFRLDFISEMFFIDVRWDKIILTSQGDIHRFLKGSSSIKVLFDILDTLKELSSFNKVINSLFQSFVIKRIDKSMDDIVRDFANEFYTNKIKNIKKDVTDYGIIVEDIHKDHAFIFNIGPYSSSSNDNDQFDLFPLTNNSHSELDEINGRMMEVRLFKSDENVNYNRFKEMIELSLDYNKIL